MRRRWHVPEGFWMALGFVWGFGWVPVYFVVYALAVPGGLNGQDHVVSPIFFGAWFGVPATVALVIVASHAVRWLAGYDVDLHENHQPNWDEWVSGGERADEPHDH